MSSSRAMAACGVGIYALVVLIYLPTLRGGFVYDSISQVLYSDFIHQPAHWGDLLSFRVLLLDELDRNRPLHLASLMLDAAIWDRKPFGFRLTSVLLHALNTALLFLFLLRMVSGRNQPHLPSWPAAMFGALVFSLHPLVVEAVAEPSNREDLLVLLPLLAGLLLITKPRSESPRCRGWLNGALIFCSFAGVLAKESGVALPLIFAVACRLFHPADSRFCLPGLVGGFFLNVGYLGLAYVLRPGSSAVFFSPPQPLAGDFLVGAATQLRIWTLQLGQVIWPVNLSAHYPGESIAGISLPLALLVVTGTIVAAGWLARGDRLLALGVAVYGFALLPASNLLPQYHPVADRFLYVPLAGVGMAATALVARAGFGRSGRWERRQVVLVAAGVALLVAEGVANHLRQRVWQEPATLWSDVLRHYPHNGQALIGISNVRWREGDYEGALEKAGEAMVESRGQWAEAWALQAACEWKLGRKEQARESLRQARERSKMYARPDLMAAALFFSPDQLEALGNLSREP